MQTRVVLVGIGGYGQTYLPALLHAAPERGIQFVGGVDPAPERCAMLPLLQDAGVPVYASLDQFYAGQNADLVIVSAPIHYHARLTVQALEHGAHVLCEKPLAGSLEDAQAMQQAQQAAGKIVAIGYQWSFSDAILALKRDIPAGRFGRPLSAKSLTLWPRTHGYYRRSPWAGRILADDGSMVLDSPANNATAHYLHNLLFLLGPTLETAAQPVTVDARLYRANDIENYDTAAMHIPTDSGADVLFLTTHAVLEEVGPLQELAFEHAVVTFPNETYTFQARLRDGSVIDYGNPNDTGENKLWTTIEAIRAGGTVPCSIPTAFPHLQCMLMAQQAGVQNFPEEKIQFTPFGENDGITWVEGLGEQFQACYQANRMENSPFSG